MIEWGFVRYVFCPQCGKKLTPTQKAKVPNHLPQKKPSKAAIDCVGSGSKPRTVEDFGGRTHNYS